MRKLLLLIVFFISGCSYTKPLMVSSTNLGQKEIPKITGTGVSSATYIFGFRSIGSDDSMQAAINDFKKRSKIKGITGDTMVNVFVDNETTYLPAWWFPVYIESTTTVFGTLVEYEGIAKEGSEAIHPPDTKNIKWYER